MGPGARREITPFSSCGSERMGILTGSCTHTGCVASPGAQRLPSLEWENTSRGERGAFKKERVAGIRGERESRSSSDALLPS